MTTSQILACAIAWTAAIVAVIAYVLARRRSRPESVAWTIDGGEITFDQALTERQVEEFKARWVKTYGNNQAAHRVEELRPVAPVACSTFRPSTEPADSGLCAGCGMYDYKHRESP